MKLLTTIILTLLSYVCAAQCGGTKYRIIPGGDGGKILDGSSYQPGDTLALNASSAWSYFFVSNINTNGGCPVVITTSSQDSVVNMSAGIVLSECRGVKITGRRIVDAADTLGIVDTVRTNTFFGIQIKEGGGVAIDIQGKSRSIFIDRVYAYKKGYGVWFKVEVNDPAWICDTSYVFMGAWSWRLDSLTILQSVFRNIDQDIIYAGSTGQLPTDRPITCGEETKEYAPLKCSNITIQYSYFDSANRTAIQVSGGLYGRQIIHGNYVRRMGYEYNQQQGTAISIGGMTQNMHITHNNIKNTFLYALLDLGVNTNYMEYNIVDSTGYIPCNPFMDMDSLAAASGCTNVGGHVLKNTISDPSNILSSTKPVYPDTYTEKSVVYRWNTLGKNATNEAPEGNISFANFSAFPEYWTTDNLVCRNTRLDGTTPADVRQFTYNPGSGNQDWPEYRSGCYKKTIRFKWYLRPNPYNY